jgi:hypothetical protein
MLKRLQTHKLVGHVAQADEVVLGFEAEGGAGG